MIEIQDLATIVKKDIRQMMQATTITEARYLVDLYYQIQDIRKASGNQISSSEGQESNQFLRWVFGAMEHIEETIKKSLDAFSDNFEVGKWSKSITGIGPVISAALLAHIDINKAPTTGHILSFAGNIPEVKWEKGQKRPWNADLKVLLWKVGESFVKVSGNPKDHYGKLYLERKAYERAKNLKLEYKDQAEQKLKDFKIGKDTEAYKHYIQGFLPPGHIHARAKRWTVKIFISHWHHVAYVTMLGKEPPVPYPIAHMGHVDLRQIPNWP